MDVEWAEISDLRRDACERTCAYVRACVYTYYLASAFIPMVTRHKKRQTSDKHGKPNARWQVALVMTQLDGACVFFRWANS